MTRQPLQPRMMTMEQVCQYLGRSDDYVRKLAGFPKKHPVVKLYDRAAIDEWVDQTAGRALTYEDILLGRSREKRGNTVSSH